MEVVINGCYGGFSLSHEAVMAYASRKGLTLYSEARHGGLFYSYFTVPPERYHALSEELRISNEGYGRLNDLDWHFSERDIERSDPDLVAVVRELGAAANGNLAGLRVVEIPDGIEYEIEEYDGLEHIAETHRTWS